MSRVLDDPVGKVATIGADGEPIHAAHQITAHEWQAMEFKRYEVQSHAITSEGFNDYAQRMGLNWMERYNAEQGFYSDASAALRGDAAVIANNPEAAKVASGISGLNADVLKRMQALGVEGADAVDSNAHYLTRKFNYDQMRLLNADPEYKPQMQRLFAEAIRNAQPELAAGREDLIAKNMITRIRAIPTDRESLGFLNDGGRAKFAASLRQGAVFSDGEIDDILGHVYGSNHAPTDAGVASRLKHRTLLDETHSVTWKDAAGNEKALAFKDILRIPLKMTAVSDRT
jgi:hypothetical protein